MDHIAIMKKSWGLLPKIISGEKVIESRWYLSRKPPWNKVTKGDKVYFKNSGEPIEAVAEVKSVKQFDFLTPKTVRDLLKEYGEKDGIENKEIAKYYKLFKNKKYAIFVFLTKVKKTKPFKINKEGYGALSAWISVKNITKIKM